MKHSAFLSIVLAAVASCGGTETGNGFTQEIRVGAHSSDEGEYAVSVAAGGGVVSEAWMIIGGMTLIEDGDCGANGDGVDMPPLNAADHALGDVDLTVPMNEGDYCQLTLPIGGEGLIPTGAPPALGGETAIVVIGQTGAGTDFTIVGGAPTIAIRGSGAFALSVADGPLFLGFDVASWLAGLDIDSGDLTSGQVLIDAANNATLSAQFAQNVAGGIELYRDANGNGQVDAGELPVASGQ